MFTKHFYYCQLSFLSPVSFSGMTEFIFLLDYTIQGCWILDRISRERTRLAKHIDILWLVRCWGCRHFHCEKGNCKESKRNSFNFLSCLRDHAGLAYRSLSINHWHLSLESLVQYLLLPVIKKDTSIVFTSGNVTKEIVGDRGRTKVWILAWSAWLLYQKWNWKGAFTDSLHAVPPTFNIICSTSWCPCRNERNAHQPCFSRAGLGRWDPEVTRVTVQKQSHKEEPHIRNGNVKCDGLCGTLLWIMRSKWCRLWSISIPSSICCCSFLCSNSSVFVDSSRWHAASQAFIFHADQSSGCLVRTSSQQCFGQTQIPDPDKMGLSNYPGF